MDLYLDSTTPTAFPLQTLYVMATIKAAPSIATNDLAVLIPPLVGALLSLVTGTFVFMTFIFIPIKPGHIRQKLICNLIVAELILQANNSTSGIMILARGRNLDNGPWCTANGFITQLAVQAVDCCVFLISFILLYMIIHPSALLKPSIFDTILLLIAPWILPLITSSIAVAKHYIHPIGGNYCWIQANPVYLRYVLAHGWRFAVIVAVVAMGVFTRYYLRRHTIGPQDRLEHTEILSKDKGIGDGHNPMEQLPETYHQQEALYDEMELSEREKVLRLSGYPVVYIILWLPGIANRVAEATGHEIRALKIMQASTAFIGFGHAVSFGWNEVRHKFSVQKLIGMLLGFVLGD